MLEGLTVVLSNTMLPDSPRNTPRLGMIYSGGNISSLQSLTNNSARGGRKSLILFWKMIIFRGELMTWWYIYTANH